MDIDKIITKLHSMQNPEAVKGMSRFGINQNNNLGISVYHLRQLAKKVGVNHDIALQLWNSGIHDARLLACFIDDPLKINGQQMNAWAHDFDSWDICDQACTSLFDKSPYAWDMVFIWSKSDHEFVKRGAFSLLAGLAIHDVKSNDNRFLDCVSLIKKNAVDDRNYVKKAVSWAVRNIGKRNLFLNKLMIKLSQEIIELESRSARWIARDALGELTSERVQIRIKKKEKKKK